METHTPGAEEVFMKTQLGQRKSTAPIDPSSLHLSLAVEMGEPALVGCIMAD